MSSCADASAEPFYSVILPTYNEVGSIAYLLWLLLRALEGLRFEAIVVDDSSSDGTQDAVRSMQKVYGDDAIKLLVRPAKLGLGTAYKDGLRCARGDFVVLMDADLSHHPKYIPQMVRLQREAGCDVVVGTRYARGGGVAGWGLGRKVVSRGANTLAAVLLGARVSDLTGKCAARAGCQCCCRRVAWAAVVTRSGLLQQSQPCHFAALPLVFTLTPPTVLINLHQPTTVAARQ